MQSNLSQTGTPEGDQQTAPPPPRALKIAVIVMGVILVVGFVAVFITIGYRIANPRVPSPGEAGSDGFERSVAIPAGGEISGLEFTGDRALITVTGSDGTKTLIVLDTSRGRTLGRFTLAPE